MRSFLRKIPKKTLKQYAGRVNARHPQVTNGYTCRMENPSRGDRSSGRRGVSIKSTSRGCGVSKQFRTILARGGWQPTASRRVTISGEEVRGK